MKKLYLSQTDRKIFGFCGGLSEMLGIDSTLLRLVFIFLCLLTGIAPLLITYIIAGIITPGRPKNQQEIK
ncbi:MAG: PspC domain-containing protein [Phycisphaerae bacterium]|nr:PspC domain-containing protein [Phycisphaerae bacterium]